MKGSAYERELASLFSLWWSDGKRDDIFGRSAGSGGRFTARRKSGKDTFLQGGDIVATDADGEPLMKALLIEAKTGYGTKVGGEIVRWDILDFMDSRQEKPVLAKMWEQCCRDATISNRTPVLIFRRNRRSPCMLITNKFYQDLVSFYGAFVGNRIDLSVADISGVILSLQDFFEWIVDIRGFLCSETSQSVVSKATLKRRLICRPA
jgi:hypothetical protein